MGEVCSTNVQLNEFKLEFSWMLQQRTNLKDNLIVRIPKLGCLPFWPTSEVRTVTASNLRWLSPPPTQLRQHAISTRSLDARTPNIPAISVITQSYPVFLGFGELVMDERAGHLKFPCLCAYSRFIWLKCRSGRLTRSEKPIAIKPPGKLLHNNGLNHVSRPSKPMLMVVFHLIQGNVRPALTVSCLRLHADNMVIVIHMMDNANARQAGEGSTA
jgi:hypothetical protein